LCPRLFRDLSNEFIDPLDRLEHRLAQNSMSKAIPLLDLIVRVRTQSLQAIEEESKRPLAIRTASHALKPPIRNARNKPPLDTQLPPAHTAIVHPHQRPARERMAISIRQRALSARTHVCEHQRADRLARQTLEVAAVPGGDRGSKDARLRAKVYLILLRRDGVFVGGLARRGRGRGVVADAEAVTVVRAAVVEAQAGVVALGEDAVGGRGDEVGEQDGRVARVDEEATHGDYVGSANTRGSVTKKDCEPAMAGRDGCTVTL